MKYEITFIALTMKGEVAGTRTFCITSSERLDLKGKAASLLRLCVEYARLTGIKCSLAEITDIDEQEECLIEIDATNICAAVADNVREGITEKHFRGRG